MSSFAACAENASVADSVNAYNINGGTLAPRWPKDTPTSDPTCEVIFTGQVASGIGNLDVVIEWGDGATTPLGSLANGASISELHEYATEDEFGNKPPLFAVYITPVNNQSPKKAACLGATIDYRTCEKDAPDPPPFVFETDCTQDAPPPSAD